MNRYITNDSQLFDPGDILHTVSETAQDVERLYNRFTDTDIPTNVPVNLPRGSPDIVLRPNPDLNQEEPEPEPTNYLPYIVVGGGVAILVIWWMLKKPSKKK